MKCEKCGSRIPNDSLFCPECGIKLTDASFDTMDKVLDASQYETIRTIWPSLAFVLWLFNTLVFSIGLPIVLGQFKIPYTWTYYVSIVLYVVVIGLGLRGYIEDRRLLKQGKTAKGNSICFTMMIFSAYFILMTLQTIVGG